MFTEYANIHSEPTPFEYMPAATTLGPAEVGMPLVLSGGALVKATGTTKPEYICMSGETGGNLKIAVIPVISGRKYVCKATAAISAPKRGTKYTIAADGSGITATTEGGVAALDGWDGTAIAAGDTVTVRF